MSTLKALRIETSKKYYHSPSKESECWNAVKDYNEDLKHHFNLYAKHIALLMERNNIIPDDDFPLLIKWEWANGVCCEFKIERHVEVSYSAKKVSNKQNSSVY
ncbi:hypothetical protein DTO96_101993 [Ephemeroptericola cinctiostellae]|uniref:Uncharacterized protein n=1 Tax=Ephemeroptericola cinctiostellae TaxID=2268024 RepID=A0A345DD09_9BURK|nr:hypothetical protein [Ephemeroptericola cinctiostellae]AXF86247.1 hypothetical protein DTO96_101993 [Ephemeroptericola cinctiostellae]